MMGDENGSGDTVVRLRGMPWSANADDVLNFLGSDVTIVGKCCAQRKARDVVPESHATESSYFGQQNLHGEGSAADFYL